LLEKVNAPKDFVDGRSAAASWFEAKGLVVEKEETLWANVATISELPTDIYRYEMESSMSDEQRLELLIAWPHSREDRVFWSFDAPPAEFLSKYQFQERGKIGDWKSARKQNINIRQVAVHLLNESLKSICLARGLKLSPDGSLCYFPDALLPNNRLPFVRYDQQRTWVRTVGIRNFKTIAGKESCRYHLAPQLSVWLDHEVGSLVAIRVRLFLTTLEGVPLERKPAFRKRKRICRAWWNYEWLSRTLAILQFLAADAPAIQFGKIASQRLTIAKQPLSVGIGYGLDESLLGPSSPVAEEVEETAVELDEEEESDEERPSDDQ
jgi:hypothetical protein